MSLPKSDKFEFFLGVRGGLHIKCLKDDTEVHVEYQGTDGLLPKILLECPSCKESTVVKIQNVHHKGFPSAPST